MLVTLDLHLASEQPVMLNNQPAAFQPGTGKDPVIKFMPGEIKILYTVQLSNNCNGKRVCYL